MTDTKARGDNSPPERAARQTLDEPIVVSSFWKNRKHDAVVVSLKSFEGRNFVDVRQHFMNQQGALQPSSKGLLIGVLRLPELKKAVSDALKKAIELGMLEEGDSK
jgi:hypothetical protein